MRLLLVLATCLVATTAFKQWGPSDPEEQALAEDKFEEAVDANPGAEPMPLKRSIVYKPRPRPRKPTPIPPSWPYKRSIVHKKRHRPRKPTPIPPTYIFKRSIDEDLAPRGARSPPIPESLVNEDFDFDNQVDEETKLEADVDQNEDAEDLQTFDEGETSLRLKRALSARRRTRHPIHPTPIPEEWRKKRESARRRTRHPIHPTPIPEEWRKRKESAHRRTRSPIHPTPIPERKKREDSTDDLSGAKTFFFDEKI